MYINPNFNPNFDLEKSLDIVKSAKNTEEVKIKKNELLVLLISVVNNIQKLVLLYDQQLNYVNDIKKSMKLLDQILYVFRLEILLRFPYEIFKYTLGKESKQFSIKVLMQLFRMAVLLLQKNSNDLIMTGGFIGYWPVNVTKNQIALMIILFNLAEIEHSTKQKQNCKQIEPTDLQKIFIKEELMQAVRYKELMQAVRYKELMKAVRYNINPQIPMQIYLPQQIKIDNNNSLNQKYTLDKNILFGYSNNPTGLLPKLPIKGVELDQILNPTGLLQKLKDVIEKPIKFIPLIKPYDQTTTKMECKKTSYTNIVVPKCVPNLPENKLLQIAFTEFLIQQRCNFNKNQQLNKPSLLGILLLLGTLTIDVFWKTLQNDPRLIGYLYRMLIGNNGNEVWFRLIDIPKHVIEERIEELQYQIKLQNFAQCTTVEIRIVNSYIYLSMFLGLFGYIVCSCDCTTPTQFVSKHPKSRWLCRLSDSIKYVLNSFNGLTMINPNFYQILRTLKKFDIKSPKQIEQIKQENENLLQQVGHVLQQNFILQMIIDLIKLIIVAYYTNQKYSISKFLETYKQPVFNFFTQNHRIKGLLADLEDKNKEKIGLLLLLDFLNQICTLDSAVNLYKYLVYIDALGFSNKNSESFRINPQDPNFQAWFSEWLKVNTNQKTPQNHEFNNQQMQKQKVNTDQKTQPRSRTNSQSSTSTDTY